MIVKEIINQLSKMVIGIHQRFYGIAIGLLSGSFLVFSTRSCAGACTSCGGCGATLLLAAGIVLSKVAIKKR